ncbi:MAG: amphi-Trp domain-containing protein [Proteobacteria bacterium]|nr:amphi-Trp domain-containing protein [Pseudomonadota bacterium]
MKKSEVKLRRTVNADNVAQILNDLAASIREGTVCVENGNEFVTLSTGEDVQFELELQAGQKKSKQKFELELSWRTTPPKMDSADDFKISSQEPEITEPSPLEAEDSEESE